MPEELLSVPPDPSNYFLAATINLESTPSGTGADQATALSTTGSLSAGSPLVDIILIDATDVLFDILVFDPESRTYRSSTR